MLPSSTVENYLKAIYLAQAHADDPRALVPMGQVASALGVVPGTATTMVRALADSGLARYEPYAGVRLTQGGEKLAALVLRRHRLIELFLVEIMGMRWDEVHDDAERLEHAVSERLIERIDAMLGHPDADPHGDPIPRQDGTLRRVHHQSLLDCPLQTPLVVTRVLDQEAAFLRFVEKRQLKPGRRLEVEARDEAADSVHIRLPGRKRMTLGTRAASKLLVESLCLLVACLPAMAVSIIGSLALAGVAAAQTSAVVQGVVLDVQGGAIPGADVRLREPLGGLERTAITALDGTFRLSNVPLGAYELRVTLAGFAPYIRELELRTGVPAEFTMVLDVAAQSTLVTVSPEAAPVDTESAGTRTPISLARIERMPAAVGSRGLESVLVSFPGFAQNANGAIHPRGAHNQMTFVIDGLPISDQLTGAFANALDVSIVQTAELMTGNIPAEFGSKVSGVAVITSRSGLGVDRRLAGDALVSAAGFDTWQGAIQAGGGWRRVGYFGSATAMRTGRFLDQVSLDNLHNDGAYVRGFARADVLLTARDLLRLHGMGGRSTFDVANLRSQQAAGQDQRQSLSDGAAWVSYLRTLDARSTFESTVGYRVARAALEASAGDTPVTAAQQRRLATLTATSRYTRVAGRNTIKVGLDVQRFPVTEHFTMGITSPAFNEPGSASFNPSLTPHDLTRGGFPFVFSDQQAGHLLSGFAQSTLHSRAATLTLGLRHDRYAFLVRGQQWQPRLGLAYRLPGAAGVVRASYNRNYQTPPNENLLLSNSPQAAELAPDSVKAALGGAYRPIRPERQDVFEVGYQRTLTDLAHLDVSLYRKQSKDQQDNNNFFDTGVIFPTTLSAIRVIGADVRLTFPARHGLSGALSATTGRAISTPPFTGGLFLGQEAIDLLSSGPFPIDHDQRLSVHATAQYAATAGLWLAGSVRYDSGLVANPSDPAEVAADADYADLLPYVNLAADVPRVRPRTIIDLAAGYDATSAGRRTWSVQLQVTNLANVTALYNFQSVFVGTRLVQPRTLAVRVRRYF